MLELDEEEVEESVDKEEEGGEKWEEEDEGDFHTAAGVCVCEDFWY